MITQVHPEAEAAALFTAMDKSPNAFVAVDYDYTFLFVNEVAEKFYSKNRSELLGRKVKDVFPELWNFGPFKNGRIKASAKLPFELDYHSPFVGRWVQLVGKPYENFYTYTYHLVDQQQILRQQLRKELGKNR